MTSTTVVTSHSRNGLRAFATRKYPTFGRGVYSAEKPPATVTNSPFYWWYMFLGLNAEYAKAVDGKSSTVAQDLVDDFGDVRSVDFKTWWNAHVDLFAEPISKYQMYVATHADGLVPFNSTDAINLVVPLSWTNKGLKRRFAQIIDKLVQRQPAGVQAHKRSEAKYKLGRKWNTSGFRYAYDVYVARQTALAEAARTGKKIAWADVAISARLPSALGVTMGKRDADSKDKRRVLTILALRHYRNAEAFIAAAASQTFPAAK